MDGIWLSRRSPVITTKGVCASSQTLATGIGLKILRDGGNAADAAVAMAAALNVTEPCSTGIGGDAFALYYDAKSKKVSCLQGNGASGRNFTLELLNERGFGDTKNGFVPLDARSGLCCTVPGAAALWEDMITEFGRLSLLQVLHPAIELAENGFPIAPITADHWSTGFLQGEEAFRVFRPDNQRVHAGQIFKNPDLAQTFRTLGELGASNGFYRGRIADAIIEACSAFGGVLTHDDLDEHSTCRAAPISIVYHGIRVYQTPPPSQGLAVLLALQYMQAYERLHGGRLIQDPTFVAQDMSSVHYEGQHTPNWAHKYHVEELHVSLECMRRAYCDALHFITDPRSQDLSYGALLEELLSDDYADRRVQDIDVAQSAEVLPGDISEAFTEGETVYFCVVDNEGNACSFINSNYMGFGSGIVPQNTGFTLQNRGHNFSLKKGHLNEAEPRKRPYHTIIPGLATYAGRFQSEEDLCAVFGNMGGFMQPMGHVQLLRNVLDYQLDAQAACDAPRWYLMHTGDTQDAQDCRHSVVSFEEGFGRYRVPVVTKTTTRSEDNRIVEERHWQEVDRYEEIVAGLRRKGHRIDATAPRRGDKRTMYGRAQFIWKEKGKQVYWAGSDPRADGCAMPFC